MKRKYLTFLILGILIFASCEDYLDYAPELEIGEEDVYKDFLSAQGYLDNCYNSLQANHSRIQYGNFLPAHCAMISDEGAPTNRRGHLEALNSGDWYGKAQFAEVGYNNNDLGNAKGRIISNSFYCIRICNNLIQKVPNMTDITDEERDLLLGQAYFFRSWSYFQIIRRWGGMQVFDKPYSSDEWRDVPRLTYQESTEWLIEGYDKAFELLPDDWNEANTGRVTKISALAAKSMAALYAASPLMQNEPGEPVVNQGYGEEWARTALEYTHDALSYIWNNVPEKDMAGLDATTQEEKREAYRHIFYYKNFVGEEQLFYAPSAGLLREPHGGSGPGKPDLARHFMNVRFSGRPGGFGKNYTSVTQNLVDKFEVINPEDGEAYPFGHEVLGSEEEQWEEPYANRDPRFYNNIFYTGDATHGVDNQGNPLYFENYPGGADYRGDNPKGGYLCKKWWWPSANKWTKGWQDYYYNGIFIRTTQLYLDYAELMNEVYGPNSDPEGYGMTAVDAINLVRNRVGMVDVNSIYTGSKEDFRDRIRNERAVELMWEDHRWHDLRRWMIAEDVFEGTNPIQGVAVEDLTPEINDVGEKSFRYEKYDITSEVRVFDKKHYWYPLPQDHMQRLRKVEQNPGW